MKMCDKKSILMIVFLTSSLSFTQTNVEQRLDRIEAKLDSTIALLKTQIGEKYYLTVHFIDVGHGDCIFIETPNDNQNNGKYEGLRILIDAGDRGCGANYIIPYLKNVGLKEGDTIDYLIATHGDADHIAGMPAIYTTFQVNATLDPGYDKTGSDGIPDRTQPNTDYGKFYKKASEEPNSKFYWNPIDSGLIRNMGDHLSWGKELEVRILYFNPDTVNNDINSSSIVLWLKFDDVSFLFPGDAEGKDKTGDSTTKYVEKYLLEHYEPSELKTTVLKVAHHGSETSSSNDFIKAVRPSYAIIFAGCKYSLPKESVLRRYRDAGAIILRTDEGDQGKSESSAGGDDDIMIKTDGKELKIITEQ